MNDKNIITNFIKWMKDNNKELPAIISNERCNPPEFNKIKANKINIKILSNKEE